MTVEKRYEAATAYVRRAIDAVGSGFVGAIKVEHPKNELQRIEARWLRATTQQERSQIARDAELLADRTKENLPGAPSDWKRTNLYKGEVEKQAGKISYTGELAAHVSGALHSMGRGASKAADSLGGLGKWLLIGGAVVIGLRLVGAFDRRGER